MMQNQVYGKLARRSLFSRMTLGLSPWLATLRFADTWCIIASRGLLPSLWALGITLGSHDRLAYDLIRSLPRECDGDKQI